MQINPLIRPKLPVKAQEITNRINEVSFNASLVAEMRAIHFVSKMVNHTELDRNVYKNLHMHMIESSEAMQELNASSKLKMPAGNSSYSLKKSDVMLQRDGSKIILAL